MSYSFTEKVKSLNFPLGSYVIIGSGTLDVLGIRKAKDVDISVTPELRAQLRASGKWEEEEKFGKLFLKRDDIDIVPELSWEAFPTTTQETIDSALVIDGIPFMNLEILKAFKTARAREKDLADLILIEKYFKNNP